MTRADRDFVLAVVRRIVGSTDAADAAQDTLLLAFRKRDQFRGDALYRTWLYRIAVTTSLGYLKARRRRFRFAYEPATWEHAPADELARREEVVLLHAAIDALPPHYRDVLRDAPIRELARDLGITIENVKIRRNRARKALRDYFGRATDRRV